ADAEGVDGGAAPTQALQPTWIKFLRVGSRFAGFTSADGVSWRLVADVPDFVIASNAYAGIVATSGSEAAMASTVIENITVAAPPVTVLPARPDAGAAEARPADAGVDVPVD